MRNDRLAPVFLCLLVLGAGCETRGRPGGSGGRSTPERDAAPAVDDDAAPGDDDAGGDLDGSDPAIDAGDFDGGAHPDAFARDADPPDFGFEDAAGHPDAQPHDAGFRDASAPDAVSSSDAGPSAACGALSNCCPELSFIERVQCEGTVASDDGLTCLQELLAARGAGYCGGTPDAGAPRDSGVRDASPPLPFDAGPGSCGDLSACCTDPICTLLVVAGDQALCASYLATVPACVP